MSVRKALHLSSLAFRNPAELWDRLSIKFEYLSEKYFLPAFVLPENETYETFLARLGEFFDSDIGEFSAEKEIQEIEKHIVEQNTVLKEKAPFSLIHNSDFTLARSCYILCRILRPEVVLETGVAYGVNSAFILTALEKNRRGALHSIDLPPIGEESDKYIGYFIPEPVRYRWKLHRGSSKRMMPQILPMLKSVDVFIHDSLHTYYNMKREFESVEPYLNSQAAIIADDVDDNAAFVKLIEQKKPPFWGIIREKEKDSSFGIYIKKANANAL